MSEQEQATTPELDKAKAREIRNNITLRWLSFIQRWLIIWLVAGGFIKLDIVKEAASWISG